MRGGPRWRFRFVTPWIVSKERRGGRALEGEEAGVDTPAVARELAKSLTARAHKFTALSARETVWQRVGGHFAHYVADALLPGGFRIENVSITRNPIRLSSAGNAKIFSALTWEGEVTLVISEPLLPWFSLLALCGGGENAGKGFGGVELIPISK